MSKNVTHVGRVVTWHLTSRKGHAEFRVDGFPLCQFPGFCGKYSQLALLRGDYVVSFRNLRHLTCLLCLAHPMTQAARSHRGRGAGAK